MSTDSTDFSEYEPRVREYGKNESSPAIDDATVEIPVPSERGGLQWVEREVNNLSDFKAFWPYSTMPVVGDLETLCEVIVSGSYMLDLEIDALYDQRFLETATGGELERIGARVNAERRSGEGDPKYRTRVMARHEQRAAHGTFEEIASLIQTLLGDIDATISTAEDEGPKTVAVTLPSSALSESPFTVDEVETEISKALSPETSLSVGTDDTFVFSVDNSSEKGAGFGEGKWS